MKKLLKIVLTLVISSLLFVSCAKAPETEINNAKSAVEKTKSVQAELYLPGEFNSLQDSMNVALLEVENQNSRFALFRNYKKATNTLNNIVTLSDEVYNNTLTRKEEVRNEVQNKLEQVRLDIEQVRNLIKMAPKGKEGKLALQDIENDVILVEAVLNETITLMEKGEYLTALDKVNASSEKVASLILELKDVINKTNK